MDSAERAIARVLKVQQMSNEAVHDEVLRCEEWTKEELLLGRVTQEEAWDVLFGLLHECDGRGMVEDRRRILASIDTKTYNPFRSKNPDIRFLATLRARIHGLIQGERN